MTVFIPKKAYLAVVAASVRFANKRIPKDDWLEVSGILIGKNKKKNVIISEAYPIMHQIPDKDAVIDQYVWTDEDYIVASDIELEAYERNEFIVGWFHSHPGFKIMMSHIDIKTTLSYQINNPQAICLVFNPQRLVRQMQLPDKKGDPEIKLQDDPGFLIYRLNDPDKGIQASYHEIDFKIEGFDNEEQIVEHSNKFASDVTNLFPIKDVSERFENYIEERIAHLNSIFVGTEEYLKTLSFKGESNRIPEVLENQKKDINKSVAETANNVQTIRDFMDYLEYKEREAVIPKVTEILSKWDEIYSKIDEKIDELSKKF